MRLPIPSEESSSADSDSADPGGLQIDHDETSSSSDSDSDFGNFSCGYEFENLREDPQARDPCNENGLTFRKVWQEELHLIAQHREKRRELRSSRDTSQQPPTEAEAPLLEGPMPTRSSASSVHLPSASSRPRFSVAFSGGGVRAAAFQAGALWQLAEAGQLGRVDYIACVSGGSYTAAAFASHVVEAGQPGPRESHEAWYRAVVARTLCRMQTNASYLARDLGKQPWSWPTDGSGHLPRIFDIPILAFLVLVNTAMTPLFYMIFIVVPGVELFDMLVGGDLRWMFCDSKIEPGLFELFYPPKLFNSSFKTVTIALFCTSLGLAFLFWSLANVPLKESSKEAKRSLRASRRFCWLCMKSTSFVLTRIVMCIVALYALILVILNYHMTPNSAPHRLCMCHRYSLLIQNQTISNRYFCADTFFNTFAPYYATKEYNATTCLKEQVLVPETSRPPSNFTASIWEQCGGQGWFGPFECKQGLRCRRRSRWYSQCEPAPTLEPPLFVSTIDYNHPLQTVVLDYLALFLLAVLLIPFYPRLYGFVLGVAGPAALFLVLLVLIDIRTFGALNGSEDASNTADVIARTILVLDVVLMPFQHIARGCCHRVYRQSLHKAFFANGKDSTWKRLGDSPFCPFLLVTATINDFMRPGETCPLSEIAQSTLHIGGQKTGYIPTPASRSLSRSVALSGAAIDAFFLGKNDHAKYRFWFEMMSLSMGDFMNFNPRQRQRKMAKTCVNAMLRLPAMVVGECFYGLLLFAEVANVQGWCNWARPAFAVAGIVAGLATLASFFAWLPGLDPILHCLPIRGIHLLTRFFHCAERPPSLVCVTDGGLLDNTGVMQLLRRQCVRILLVYGGNDPKGKFKWLRKVVDAAGNERLASFHDPHDPARDFREIIQDFNENTSQPFLHLRIRYGWRQSDGPLGDLYVVTNRLTTTDAGLQVPPLLTEEEIIGRRPPGDLASDLEGLRQTDLGGCCCDCCHRHGCNFGPKFPNIHQMNQCLTPQLFNCLCRLGHRSSREAIRHLAASGQARLGQAESS